MTNVIPRNIKFMHYRAFDTKTGAVSSTGGATVAYTDDDPDPIRFAVALCRDESHEINGKSDNFNKAVGRMVSAGRLMKRPDLVETSLKDTAKDFERDIDEFMLTVYGYRRYRKFDKTPSAE